jgi:hypothetical protein
MPQELGRTLFITSSSQYLGTTLRHTYDNITFRPEYYIQRKPERTIAKFDKAVMIENHGMINPLYSEAQRLSRLRCPTLTQTTINSPPLHWLVIGLTVQHLGERKRQQATSWR